MKILKTSHTRVLSFKGEINSTPNYFILFTFLTLLLFSGCSETENDDNEIQPEIAFQFNHLSNIFQQNSVNLVLENITIVENAGSSTAEKINYLINNSHLLGKDSTDSYVTILLVNEQDAVKSNLIALISSITGNKPISVVNINWDFNGQKLTSIALVNSSTHEIIYDAIASNLVLKSNEINSPSNKFVGFKEITQPTNPGDLYNRWEENIFGTDLYTVAISWGTASCDIEGCITIPNDPNLWIEVEIESKLGWTADAVVSGYQVSPDCKSVTFQITVVAAGPLATIDIETDADGIKVGASVKGPVGTFKKTFNCTWNCP